MVNLLRSIGSNVKLNKKTKKIKILNKKPLMIHSLQLCKKSKIFNKIHLSTNSKKYARIAKKFGFKRF